MSKKEFQDPELRRKRLSEIVDGVVKEDHDLLVALQDEPGSEASCSDDGYCYVRVDQTHCKHWWEGDAPCCSCGHDGGDSGDVERALENAPIDDEPETAEEQEVVARAREDVRQGRVLSQAELEKELDS